MKGVYILLFLIKKDINVTISALGKIFFKKSRYAYVGSAQNGIEKRVERHLRKNKKIRWHIDHLLINKNVKIEKVLYKETNRKDEECKTAKELMKNSQLIDKFGCSDCRCKSHLFRLIRFKKQKGFKTLK